MSEIEDLIAVYGAADIAVQEHDPTGERRARVASVLPYYESLEVHWYSDLLEAARERGATLPRSVGLSEESIGFALENLSDGEPGSPRLAARRLLGLYAAAQAIGEIFGPKGTHGELVRTALLPLFREEVEARDDAAGRLHEFITAAPQPGVGIEAPDEKWQALLELAHPDLDIAVDHPRPCTGRLVRRTPGAAPVTTLEAAFDVTGIPFDRAIRFLSPENWPHCCAFWCAMNPIHDGVPAWVHRYDEFVSTNCADPANAVFTAHAELDFVFTIFPGRAAITGYDLARGRPNPDLLVDSGSLVVYLMPNGVLRVRTTKRLKLKGAYSGEALAMIACVFGWSETSKDLMFNCAREDGHDGTDFPAEGQMARSGAGPSQQGGAKGACSPAHEHWCNPWADEMARMSARMMFDSARMWNHAIRSFGMAGFGSTTPPQVVSAHPAEPAAGEET